MTKRNKRLSFFFRAARSLSSQLFSGYRAKEVKSRRRRRHFKFFAGVSQRALTSPWKRRVTYSIKNERVRWGYNLAKFKKKRMFYYKLSSRIFFRRFFGFSNHSKVGNFQSPLRESPCGYLKFFSMYKHKPYILVRSLRWLKSYFSFYNMQTAKYLIFAGYNNMSSLFRPYTFWNKKSRVNTYDNRFSAQSLFLFTQPVARSAQYSELDFFKKKMATSVRPVNRKSSFWFTVKQQNFTNKFAQKQTLRGGANYTQNLLSRGGSSPSALPQQRLNTTMYSRVFSKGTSRGGISHGFIKIRQKKKSLLRGIAGFGLTKDKFAFFFRHLIYKLRKNLFYITTQARANPQPSVLKTSPRELLNRRFSILNVIKRKLLLLKNFNLKLRLDSTLLKLKKNNDVRNLLLSGNKRVTLSGSNPLNNVIKQGVASAQAVKLLLLGGTKAKLKKKARTRCNNKLSGFSRRAGKGFFFKKLKNSVKAGSKLDLDFLKKISFLKKKYNSVLSTIVSSFNKRKVFVLKSSAEPIINNAFGTVGFNSRFCRKLQFANSLLRVLKTRKILLSTKVLRVLNVDKKYLLKHRITSKVEDTFRVLSAAGSDSKLHKIKNPSRANKFLYKSGLYNALSLFKASAPLNIKIFKLLNDKRDTTLQTLKFLYRVRGVVNDIKENPLTLDYSGLDYCRKSDVFKKGYSANRSATISRPQVVNALHKNSAGRSIKAQLQVLPAFGNKISAQKRRLIRFSLLKKQKPGFFLKYLTGYSDIIGTSSRPANSKNSAALYATSKKFFGGNIRIRNQIRPFKALNRKPSIIKRFWWRKWSKVLRAQPPVRGSRLKKPHTDHGLSEIINNQLRRLGLKNVKPLQGGKHRSFYKKGWVYDMESHAYVRRNKIKLDRNRINPSTNVFTFRTYKSFLKQQKLEYLKKKMYGFSSSSNFGKKAFSKVLRFREHTAFTSVLRGLVLPFWLNLVKSNTSPRVFSLFTQSARGIIIGVPSSAFFAPGSRGCFNKSPEAFFLTGLYTLSLALLLTSYSSRTQARALTFSFKNLLSSFSAESLAQLFIFLLFFSQPNVKSAA